MKMILKHRPLLNVWAVKVKGIVAFKGTEQECLDWIAKNKGEVVRQEPGKPKPSGERPAPAPRAKKSPAAKKSPVVRAKKTGSVKGPLPKSSDGTSLCPTGVAQNGDSPQRRKGEPPKLDLPADSQDGPTARIIH
jgi:hypothetical protein